MAEESYTIDEYQLLNCVASGTYTQVWEVLEKGTGKQLAMKLLLPEAFKESEQKQLLKHESRVGHALSHPNFVKFQKLVVTKEHGYILMDYFRAPNVKAQIGSDLVGVQARIQKLVEGVGGALAYMHQQGWLHKDVKPDNILLNKASEVRLIDFSLAGRMSGGLVRALGGKVKTIQGTRTYIAPETILRQRPTPATDIYSLGVTIFEILTGEPPFKGTSPTDLLKKHVGTRPPDPSLINKNVTPEMDKFVQRMLTKKPANRHQDAIQVLTEFRSLKVFKEDVQQLADKATEVAKAKQKASLDEASRLDSRADALRSELEKSGVPMAPRPPKRSTPRPVSAAQQAKSQPEPQQPDSGQFPPPTQPAPYGQPAYYAPAYYPGFAQQQPYPQMPGAGPYYGAPGQPPGMVPGQMPGQPYPAAGGPPQQYPPGSWGQPNAGANPAVQSPPQQRPAPPQQTQPPQGARRPAQPAASPAPVAARPLPASQQPPAQPAPRKDPPQKTVPPPRPPDAAREDDLPFMEELPPIV